MLDPCEVLRIFHTKRTGLQTPRHLATLADTLTRLRIHPTQEWHDLYHQSSIADFKKFLDFYMKGQNNGWEDTPKVRASVIRYNEVSFARPRLMKISLIRADYLQTPIDNLPFAAWPVSEAKDFTLHLSADETLQISSSSITTGQNSYRSDAKVPNDDTDGEELSFTYVFLKQTRLIGTSKAVLYMSCPDHDDLDVFVILRKADRHGNILRNANIPFAELKAVGGTGIDGVENPQDVPLINTLQFGRSFWYLKSESSGCRCEHFQAQFSASQAYERGGNHPGTDRKA
jgi:hypothetical protein